MSFTLNQTRKKFQHVGKWFMGFMFFAMVGTTFMWNNGGGGGRVEQSAANAPDPDTQVAEVDGQKVTYGEFTNALERTKQQMAQNGNAMIGPTQLGYLRYYAFEALMQEKELLARYEKQGGNVSDADIDKVRDTIVTGEKLRQTLGLASTASLSDVDSALQAQGHSLDQDLPKEGMRAEVAREALEDQATKSVNVSEQDVRDSYIQYHTRHILIDNKKRSDVQAQDQAQKILQMALQPGADFAALAKRFSDDPGTKAKGGDDPWISSTTPYVPEFKTAAFALKPGQITPQPVKTAEYGYFIIQLLATKNALPPDFETNKDKYINQYADQKKQEAWSKFETDVQNSPHTITISDPMIRGDEEMATAQQTPDVAKQTAIYRSAVADLKKAIQGSTNDEDNAASYVEIARADDVLKDSADELKAYQSAVRLYSDDPTLLMAAGDFYKSQKLNPDAIQAYERAAMMASDSDRPTHAALSTDFTMLGSKDDADKQTAWLENYDRLHPPPPPPPGQKSRVIGEYAVTPGKNGTKVRLVSGTGIPGGLKLGPSNPAPQPATGAQPAVSVSPSPGAQPAVSVSPAPASQPGVMITPGAGGAQPTVTVAPGSPIHPTVTVTGGHVGHAGEPQVH
ncbi:MAG: peptidylprolyl isomerase [Capsulimonadaceae bacterium]